MNRRREASAVQAAADRAAARKATIVSNAAAPALPDVNYETYPYAVVQRLLDETATFTFYATPDPGFSKRAVLTPDRPDDFFGINGGYGLHLGCRLHAFDSTTTVCDGDDPLRVRQKVGSVVGRFRCVLFFARFPDDRLHWESGEPPPAIYDRWRSQRFRLMNPEFTFADGLGFRGFGVGCTFPVVTESMPRLLAGAVGNLVAGFGLFRDRQVSFALCGALTDDLGFDGLITCRVVDPQGDFRSDDDPREVDEEWQADPSSTFVVMRGEKKDRSVRTEFGPKPAPDLDSLVTPSEMRSVQYGIRSNNGALRASASIGPLIAGMTADVDFNLSAPPGTAAAPGPFTTSEVYEFVDRRGTAVGVINAGVVEGISFGLQFPAAPGQPGVRFTGYGPITGGTGPFAGAQGLLTVNSVIGIAPHALSLTHVLHVIDPDGRFRAKSRS
jgi:hypothetical protein